MAEVTEKKGAGRPPKALTVEVTSKDLVGVAKRKPGWPKGSGKRGPGRPKGSAKPGPGRPKGSRKGKPGRPKGKIGRPRAANGLIGALVAKQVKAALKSYKVDLKGQVKELVAKELKRALKYALR